MNQEKDVEKPSLPVYDGSQTKISFDGLVITGLASGKKYARRPNGYHEIYVSALSPFVRQFQIGLKGNLTLKIHTGYETFATCTLPCETIALLVSEISDEIPVFQVVFKELKNPA